MSSKVLCSTATLRKLDLTALGFACVLHMPWLLALYHKASASVLTSWGPKEAAAYRMEEVFVC